MSWAGLQTWVHGMDKQAWVAGHGDAGAGRMGKKAGEHGLGQAGTD